MQFNLGQIASCAEATLEGNPETPIHGVAGLEEAGPGQVTFCAHPKYEAAARTSPAAAILVSPEFHGPTAAARLRVRDPYPAFVRVMRLFRSGFPERAPGVDPRAVVDPTAELGPEVSVGPLCVIEAGVRVGARTVLSPGVFVGRDAVIGEDCYLHPLVTVRERVGLGSRVIVHSGSVIGADGFGYLSRDGVHEKIPQLGNVIVDDDVEIGANVAIDRATVGSTRIGRGTKIDNLVHIGHNVVIGENTLLVAQVGISGSTRVGDRVTLAGQVGVVGHIEIGNGAMVGAQSGVTKSVPAETRVSGYPAMDHDRARRLHGYYRRLPELCMLLKRLERRILVLEEEKERLP